MGPLSTTLEYENKGREAFLHWAKTNAIPITSMNENKNNDNSDLESIAAAIGDAQVVALSEGFHNCREMMLLHLRIIQYLVEHHGFDTVVTESGLPESRMIWDYIQQRISPDSNDAKEKMYKQGLNKMYGEWVEGRALIEWMREYNQRHDNILHYYGSDIGGFYHDWKTPFHRIINYLESVDALLAQKLNHDLGPFLEGMSENARLYYSKKLSSLEKAQLEILLDDLLDCLDTKRDEYIAKSNISDFEWTRQSVESMRLAEAYYRNYLHRCNPETSKFVGLDTREIAMHRNVLWTLKQRRRQGGDAGKIIIIHHVAHTKTETQHQCDPWGFYTPAGQLLRQSFKNRLFVIGMVYHEGHFWKNWQKGASHRVIADIPPPDQDNGLEGILLETNQDCCFLPWNKAPLEAYPWLSSLCSIRENDYILNIRPKEWDACIFLRKASPGTPVISQQ